jgi:hypothetical protein
MNAVAISFTSTLELDELLSCSGFGPNYREVTELKLTLTNTRSGRGELTL